jgi:hypothetical protein
MAPVRLLGVLLLAGLPSLVSAGCGDVDAGSTPFPGTVLYADPAGAYQFNLLEPPWIPASFEGVAVFAVPPTDLTDLTDVTDLSSALYTLHIDTVTGTPEGNRDSEESSVFATATAATQIVEDSVETVAGPTAYELSWQPSSGLFERDVYLAGPSTATFRLQFGAKEALSGDAMVTQMILSFEPL